MRCPLVTQTLFLFTEYILLWTLLFKFFYCFFCCLSWTKEITVPKTFEEFKLLRTTSLVPTVSSLEISAKKHDTFKHSSLLCNKVWKIQSLYIYKSHSISISITHFNSSWQQFVISKNLKFMRQNYNFGCLINLN